MFIKAEKGEYTRVRGVGTDEKGKLQRIEFSLGQKLLYR